MRDAIDVEGGKQHHRNDCAPDAKLDSRLDTQRLVRIPRHVIGRKGKHRGCHQRQRDQHDRMPQRLRGKGNDDGHADQRREGIGKSAGDEQQKRHLQKIEGEKRQRRARAEPMGRGEPAGKHQVRSRKRCDQDPRLHQRQGKIEDQRHRDDRRRLARNRKPAQPHQRAKSQVAVGTAKGRFARGIAAPAGCRCRCHCLVQFICHRLPACRHAFLAWPSLTQWALTPQAAFCHVPRGLARVVGMASAGSSGQGWRG